MGEAHTREGTLEPHVGLNVQLYLSEFKLKAKGGDCDVLAISCALLSSSGEHTRADYFLDEFDSTGYLPEYQPWHGFYRPFLFDSFFSIETTADGQHHVSTLALYTGSKAERNSPVWVESTWRSERGRMTGSPVIRTAVWNRNLPSTGIVSVIHPEHNDQALKPFPKGAFHGAIALLRRRGGNGFVQKAARAKAAGAVGCIIFDGDGPLDSCLMEPGCSLELNDVICPSPGIPTVLVDKEVGMMFSAAVRSCSNGARSQILVDSSRETLTKLPPEFEEFVSRAVAGEPLHLAVLIERG